MDADRFDTLTVALHDARSRRGALGSLLLGTLGLLMAGDAQDADAKRCKKIKNRKKRKKCLARGTCTPTCAGKDCGDDGCGGSCGVCFRGTCQGGICICPTGQEVCDDECIPTCRPGTVRRPDSCDCCAVHTGGMCVNGIRCCSDRCGTSSLCQGKNGFEACTFGAQCRSGVCQDGTCTCDGDICNGTCRFRCPNARNPTTCDCCGSASETCTVNFHCCSGTCTSGNCTGLPDSTPCTFDAECASGNCHNSLHTCSGGIGV